MKERGRGREGETVAGKERGRAGSREGESERVRESLRGG